MEHLFSKFGIFEASLDALERAKQGAKQIREDVLKAKTDDDIVAELVEQYSFAIPDVDWNGASVKREEATVDLRFLPNTMAFYEQRSVMRPGEQFTISVPFTGDGGWFQCRPSTFTLNPPRCEIRRETLAFVFQGLQVDVERSKQEYESTKQQIEASLALIRADAAQHNEKIAAAVRPIIADKRGRMERGNVAISGFGLPIR